MDKFFPLWMLSLAAAMTIHADQSVSGANDKTRKLNSADMVAELTFNKGQSDLSDNARLREIFASAHPKRRMLLSW